MKNIIIATAIGMLVLSTTTANAQIRAKKVEPKEPVTTQPEEQEEPEKATITAQPTKPTVIKKQPAEPEEPTLEKRPVKPRRMQVAPYYSRAKTTPDVNQHMTWQEFLDQLPVKPPSIRQKYRPPQEIGLDWRVFEQNFCAPAAVANNLMWLDAHWYPHISNEDTPLAGGVFLARQLGDYAYFSTMNDPGDPDAKDGGDPEYHLSEGTGTRFEDMISGTVKFLKEKQISPKEVQWISLWAVPEAKAGLTIGNTPLTMERRAPKLEEVRAALKTRSIVVQIFGHYEYQTGESTDQGMQPNTLMRQGGHYFAPVGYGLDENGKLSEHTFAYHDSAGSDQDEQVQHYYDWLVPTGPWKNLPLRKIRDGGAKYASLACNNAPKEYECLGVLRNAYIRNKQVEDHMGNEQIRVLEGMMVIRL